jgi:hypothetical protein
MLPCHFTSNHSITLLVFNKRVKMGDKVASAGSA